MFKFKSYNIKKAEEKNKTRAATASSSSSSSFSSSSSSSTEKKPSSKTKTMPTAKEIKTVSNMRPVEYSPKKSVGEWHKNKTYSAKKETKVVIPSPHKKLERK